MISPENDPSSSFIPPEKRSRNEKIRDIVRDVTPFGIDTLEQERGIGPQEVEAYAAAQVDGVSWEDLDDRGKWIDKVIEDYLTDIYDNEEL